MVTASSNLGNACFEALQRFRKECVTFQSAWLYLVVLETDAFQNTGKVNDVYERLVAKLRPDYTFPSEYFLERSFILLVAAFEQFLQEVTHNIVFANPKKVGQIEFKLSEILEAESNDELIRRSIETIMNRLMYKKPIEYLENIAELLSIDHKPLTANWAVFIEAKARRDLGVHNGWKCNSIYLRKVSDAGLVSVHSIGTRLVLSEPGYLDSQIDNFLSLSQCLLLSVAEKHRLTLNKSLAENEVD
jgi:hypothetical protein